jgi:hypothetical protein
MAPAEAESRVISLEEVKKHTSDKSCWLVVHGKVYDVTDFLEEHPGGYDIILTSTGAAQDPAALSTPRWPFCGRERASRLLCRCVASLDPCAAVSRRKGRDPRL